MGKGNGNEARELLPARNVPSIHALSRWLPMRLWVIAQILIAAALVWQWARARRNARSLLRPGQACAPDTESVTFSICVAAREEMEGLERLLKEICLQEHARYEALFFDDGLAQEGAAMLRRFASRWSKVFVVDPPEGKERPQGRAAALDFLARSAHGDCLLFLGAKHELDRASLRDLAGLWRAARADALILYALGRPESLAQKILNPFREHRLMTCAPLERLSEPGLDVAVEGGAWLLARSAFLEAGGFGDPSEGLDAEAQLVRRLKARGSVVRMVDARAIIQTRRPTGLEEIFLADQRALRRFATPAQRRWCFVAGTLAMHALPFGAALWFLATGGFGLWQFWSAALLAALSWAGRFASWQPFRSSRLSLALHPALILYESILALDVVFSAFVWPKTSWKGRYWG